jgi:hypothetical protein
MSTPTSGGKAPEWLRARWERTKCETAARIQAAVDQLRQHGRDVTFESIREAIRATGVSISANTIKRNQLAYEVYLANCRKPRAGHLPQPALRELVGSFPPEKRHTLEVKISRLRREPKDAFDRKAGFFEYAAKQRDVENRLREEILRLSSPR